MDRNCPIIQKYALYQTNIGHSLPHLFDNGSTLLHSISAGISLVVKRIYYKDYLCGQPVYVVGLQMVLDFSVQALGRWNAYSAL
jgi:hypothetical protein